MKVLVVGPSPNRSKGGMATVIQEIQEDEALNSSFDIDIFESYIDGGKLKVFLFSIFAFIRFIITKRNYDVYHIHAASYGSTFRKGWYVSICKKWNKKVILHIHGACYMEFYSGLSEKKKRKVIDILKKADMVIALSQDWKNKFDTTFGLTNCYVLENGINTEKLASAIVDPQIHQTAFVALGRLGERKGTYDLVDAIEQAKKEVPELKCYLAGDGEVDKFRAMIQERELQNNIEVVGWADFAKKIELLSNTATVVLPSYNEGLPMSILEGMACGKAIISTKVGAIPEVVTEENGILVEPGDVKAIAEALVRISTDLALLRTMSQSNLYKIDEMYSMRKMHDILSGYYQKVIQI